MTRKANRQFVVAGLVAVLLTVTAAQFHHQTDAEILRITVGLLGLTAFFLLVVLGIAPWLGSFGQKYPIQNTQGYAAGYAAEPDKEEGPFWSQGWRRKRERAELRSLKAFGLYIEPDEKS